MTFKTYTLGELSVDGKGSYGIAASAVPYSDKLFTYLRITDINDDGTLNKSNLMSVNDRKAERYLLKPNDIVFARTGNSTGRNYFYDKNDGEFVFAGFLIKFSIDENKVNPRFIKYYCLSKEYRDWVHSFNTGSTRGNINAQTYANMPIMLPSREQQDLLVDTLSVIDKKIALNTAMNENLEQQAQAIYRFMFLSTHHESDRIGLLSELITIKYGKDHKKLNDGIYPVYDSGGIMRYVEKPLYDKESVLIPRKGSLNNVMYVDEPFWSVDTMFYTEMKLPNIAKFVFHFIKSKDLASLNVGSAVPSMTTDILNSMEITIPSIERLAEFDGFVSPLYRTIKDNIRQSERLSALRDALLPKLMNGEIDVSEINI